MWSLKELLKQLWHWWLNIVVHIHKIVAWEESSLLVDKWWYVQIERGCFPSWSPRVWGLSLETSKGLPMAVMSWRCSNVVHSWIEGGYLFIGKSLATKLIVTLDYNITQYIFIRGEFWQTIRLHILLISCMFAKFLEN